MSAERVELGCDDVGMKREAKSTAAVPEPGVSVVWVVDEYRLVATRAFDAGERLFHMEGEPARRPTRYTVQIGENLHLEMLRGTKAEEVFDRYFWRFMNHSCEPNAFIRRRDVIAIREIAPQEGVTFNYNTTEYDMAEPFDCRCGSAHCLGTIRGFKHLPELERRRLAPFLASHLRAHLRTRGPGALAQLRDDRA
jgi:hypothetical protein